MITRQVVLPNFNNLHKNYPVDPNRVKMLKLDDHYVRIRAGRQVVLQHPTSHQINFISISYVDADRSKDDRRAQPECIAQRHTWLAQVITSPSVRLFAFVRSASVAAMTRSLFVAM